MRKISLVTLFVLSISLSACQAAPMEALPTSSSAQISQSSSETPDASSSQEDTREPVFNGSYYSVEGEYGPIIIVNKRYPLDAAYAPGEDIEAQTAFLDLLAQMKAQGYAVSDSYSGFRSYDTQASLYQNYVNRDGQEETDRYSTRPGYSEHQTGLAYDLLDTSGNLLTEEQAVAWLREHAAQYGFIVRYIEGKEAVTGYMAESWHIRYIGPEAPAIAGSGLTLEEYLGIAGGDYAE